MDCYTVVLPWREFLPKGGIIMPIAKSFPIHYITENNKPEIWFDNGGAGIPCDYCHDDELEFIPTEIWFNIHKSDNFLRHSLSLAIRCCVCTQTAMVHYFMTPHTANSNPEPIEFLDMGWDYDIPFDPSSPHKQIKTI